MIDFIPLEDYSFYHFQFILLMTFIAFFHTLVLTGYESKAFTYNRVTSIFILVLTLLYIGLRPISGRYFVDMATYAETFYQFQNGTPINPDGDVGFEIFLKFCSQVMTVDVFFLVCASIYILPLYFASKRWFPNYYVFSFILLVGSFSFWAYGTNGIRNGMATSLFILGLSYVYKNNFKMVLFLLISVVFHKSMMLPIAALITSFFLKNTKLYFLFWVLSIFISLTMGSVIIQLFASLGFGDDRLTAYLSGGADSNKFSSTGFRFDFLIYSAAPLALAYFYVIKKGFKNKIYQHILHTYIICNAFWIMVIRANFSNRFAYLSWFLMAFVVCYPLFKGVFWKDQFKKIGIVMLLYYGFTYFMFYYYQYR